MSPVLRVWQPASVLLAVNCGETVPWECCGAAWWKEVGVAPWQGQQQGAGGLMLLGAAGEDAPEPWVAAARMASRRSIFSRRSIASLLSTWSTMFILVVRDGEPPYPSPSPSPLQRGDSRPPPEPPEPPDPTLLRLGNSASSTPSRSSSSSSSLLSSSSSPFLSGDSSLVREGYLISSVTSLQI